MAPRERAARPAEAALREAEGALAEFRASQDAARSEIGARREAAEARRMAALGERDATAGEVDRALRTRYERLRTAKSVGVVVPLSGAACGACHTTVTLNRRSQIAPIAGSSAKLRRDSLLGRRG
jgi:predicted  nucleic acid-binding Zn-ribbon protein